MLVKKGMDWYIKNVHSTDLQRYPIFAFVLCLFLAFCAEELFGVADITGAFAAGLIISTTSKAKYIEVKFAPLSYLLLTPIFFASIGLEVDLPKMDGIEVCEKIRDCVHCPILFLSARIEEKDRIIGLKAGGDDYIVKPFSIGELLARIEAHLRREARIQGKTEFRYDNDLIIDLNSRKVSFDNQVIELTKSEFDIVAFLSRHPGQVFDREMIYEKLWGLDRDGDNKNVTELIRRIRNKIREHTDREFIETVWGCGYRWAAK